jgi:hypothetical protein
VAFTNWIANRARTGETVTSPNVTIPAGIDSINVHLLVDAADFATPDKSLSIEIEVFQNKSWIRHAVINFVGGLEPNHRGKTGWWAYVGGFAALAGMLAHARVTQAGNFKWGVDGEIA